MNPARSLSRFIVGSMLCLLLLPAIVLAKSGSSDPIARMTASCSVAIWTTAVSHDKIALTVAGPDGSVFQKEFAAGVTPMFRLQDLAGKVADGSYTYEMRVIPNISSEVKRQLAAAREAGDDVAAARIQRDAGIAEPMVLSGNLTVANGSFVNSDSVEPAPSAPKAPPASSGTPSASSITSPHNPTALDIVQADDVIIQGSLCVGLDCVINESFGFDTIRLKENNTRIKFEDTSASTGFPTHDWQLTANDSASGGAEKFSIEDITAATVPFTVRGSAPTNSIFVDSTGRVGFRTATPVLDLHVATSNTPAMRLEQNNSGGFTAQTWDIAGNEANFFVRDVTGGSRLPFRIRPGAPTSSIDISADGDVGIGTASPNANAKMDISDTVQNKARIVFSGQEFLAAANSSTDGVALLLGVNRSNNRQLFVADSANLAQNTTNRIISINPSGGAISAADTTGSAKNLILQSSGGNLGIGITPTFPIHHSSGAFLSVGGAWTNASSRAYKDNITDLDCDEAMDALKMLTPVKFTYKKAPNEHHVGFIAEDVPSLVATPERTGLGAMDVVAVLTKVVKEQQKTIDELSNRLAAIEKRN
jgi:hypothetical protein